MERPPLARDAHANGEEAHDDKSSDDSADPHPLVKLQLGAGPVILTHAATLTGGSPYFAAVLSNLAVLPKDDDGHCVLFVDTDPLAFKYILDFLQSGVMPLLWESKTGFDLPLYAQIAGLAKKFQIDALDNWIALGRYREAIETTVHVHKIDIPSGVGQHTLSASPVPFEQPQVTTTSSSKSYNGLDSNTGSTSTSVSWSSTRLVTSVLVAPYLSPGRARAFAFPATMDDSQRGRAGHAAGQAAAMPQSSSSAILSAPYVDRDYDGMLHLYQNICFEESKRALSPEELRLTAYNGVPEAKIRF